MKVDVWYLVELMKKYRSGHPIDEAERYVLEREAPEVFAPGFD